MAIGGFSIGIAASGKSPRRSAPGSFPLTAAVDADGAQHARTPNSDTVSLHVQILPRSIGVGSST
jgi:hypothetical protein